MSKSRQASRATWQRSIIAAAVGLVVAAGGVNAQQSSGSINGRAKAGETVTVLNSAIGISRSATVDSTGAYQIGLLPPGTYVVTVKRADGSTVDRTIEVAAGVSSTADFTDSVQRLVITGQAPTIDVTSVESTQILSKAELDRIPVANNVTAVALLAPGASQGDSRIGSTTTRASNIASLGGASPAENTYYVNGFNVTNIVNGVAFNQVPWTAVASQEVKTGGYGAEFGRSLGGVLSTVTKRGTNEWRGGVGVTYSPDALRGSSVYADRIDNKWELVNRPGKTDDLLYNVFVGGPVIKDRLFIFGAVQGGSYKQETYGAGTQTELKNTTPQYLLKLDWNLNENNLVEFTAFSDKNKDKSKEWTQVEQYGTAKEDFLGESTITAGGENYIASWTSQITDALSLKATAGVGMYNRNSDIAGSDCPIVQDRRTSTILALGCWTGNGLVTEPGAEDKRTAFRLDGEYILGRHTIRAGLDYEEYEVVDGTAYSGVAGVEPSLFQIRVLNPGQSLANGFENTGTTPIEYVRFRHFENGGVFTTKNSAWYIEDSFQVTPDLLLYGGIRNEQFKNLNADDVPFIDVKDTWAPRLGASWDVGGKSDLKLFSTVGRYYIPVYANTNVRLSGRELDFQEFYAYGGSTSDDRFEIPALGAQLGDRVTSSDGNTPDPRSVVDPNIKPMYQDELTLGFEKALGNRWSFGVKYIHRKLKSAMDDICNDEGAANWATANGYTDDQVAAVADAIGHCFLYNPGRDLTANVDLDGTGTLTEIVIPAADLQMPKPKRTYDALQFTFDRAWDNKWMFKGSYVLAFNKGNTEGYVKSDIGQDDAGISQDFDYPGLMEGSEGYLPNDRRHTFKAFGAYALNDEWRLGANFLVQSGRPKNCFGVYDGTTDGVSQFYGDASFWCGGKVNPRGTLGRLPWTQELSLQAHYTPNWMKGLSLTVDVFNVLNKRTVRGIEEGEDKGMDDPESLYGRPILGSLQRARSVKFTALYEF